MYISPDVQATFRFGDMHGAYRFVSVCDPFYSCPTYVIARATLEYLEMGVELAAVDFSEDVLRHLLMLYGYYDKEVRVSIRQAEEFAVLGRNLLEFHEQHPELWYVTTDPSGKKTEHEILTRNKVESIQWLIQLVEQELRRIA